MDNIDDFMRQKFDSDKPAERFEFHEEYWEQAQALIEADEAKRRKRRRLLFWWFFFGLALLGIAWCTWPGMRHVPLHAGQNREEPAGKKTPGTQTPLEKQTYEAKDTIDNQLISENSESQPGNRKPGIVASNEASPEGNGQEDLSINKPSALSGDDSKNNRKGGTSLAENRTQLSKSDKKDKQRERTNSRMSGINLMDKTAGTAGTARQGSDGVALEVGAAKRDKSLVDPGKKADAGFSAKDASSVGMESVQNNLPANGATNDNPSTPADSLQTLSSQILELFRLFDPLPLPFNPVQRDAKMKAPQTIGNNKDQVDRIDIQKDKRLSWSADLAGSFYTGIGDASPWGANAGIAANYRLNPVWAVSLGAGWRFVPDQRGVNQSDTIESVTQLRYSFGYEQAEYRVESNALQVLEFPVALHWSKGALGLEAGIAPGFLMGVSGKVYKESSSSLEPVTERSVDQNRVKIDDAIYRKTHFSLFAGAEWKVTRHIGLLTKFAYRPSGVLKNYTDTTGPKQELFWIDAGLRIRF